MSRSMVTTGPSTNVPTFLGDFRSRDHLIPAPAKLDAAQFAANSAGKKHVPAGTAIGRTIAERNAAAGYGPAVDTDAPGEIYLTAFDVDDAADINDVELLRPGCTIYENRLPAAATSDPELLAILRERYHMIRATA
jgi:hypothetical protein